MIVPATNQVYGLGQPTLPTFDIWTALHFMAGAFLARADASRPFAYAVIIGTELAEQQFRKTMPFFDESVANIAVDIVTSAAGYETFRRRPR